MKSAPELAWENQISIDWERASREAFPELYIFKPEPKEVILVAGELKIPVDVRRYP